MNNAERMLVGTVDKVARIILTAEVRIATAHIDEVSVITIVRICSPRPIIVINETSIISSRLNHGNYLSLTFNKK